MLSEKLDAWSQPGQVTGRPAPTANQPQSICRLAPSVNPAQRYVLTGVSSADCATASQ